MISAAHLCVTALLLLVPAGDLLAQRWWRQTPGPWSGELLTRSSILLDDEVVYVGARVGRELGTGFTAGLLLVVLTEEGTRRTYDRYEKIEILASIGPTIEYAHQLRGRDGGG